MPQKKRIEDIAKGRTNLFSLPWQKCEPAQIQLNGRKTTAKLNTRTDFGDLPEFATSLIGGVKETVLGYMGDNGKFQITNGERRWLGARWLDENKGITVLLPCVREGNRHYTNTERNVDLLRTNNGKPLEMIEKAPAMKRLLQDNMSPKEIAERAGCSVTHVVDCLALLNLSPDVQEAVRSGEMTGTLAVDLSRRVPDKEKQTEILQTGRVKAAASASAKAPKKGATKAAPKKTKITAKHLPVTTGKKAQAEKKQRAVAAPPVVATGASFSEPREKRPIGLARVAGRDKTLDMLEELIDATSESEFVRERFDTLKLVADYAGGHVGLTRATKFILGMA